MAKYHYQYRVWDVKRNPNGSVHYTTREEGRLPIGDDDVRAAKDRIQTEAANLARKTGKDITVKIDFN